jgi:mannose-6-phosphate isomerase-like protein (cupin superfamily)
MAETTSPELFHRDELEHNENSHIFNGHEHGDVSVSFFLVHYKTQRGPSLHRHPYAEVFVVENGEALFTVDDREMTARAGDIVVAPAGSAHKFLNTGSEELRITSIHPAATMETDWLEEDG